MKVFKREIRDYSNFYPLIFTIIFIIIMFQYSFSGLEAIFYDARVKYDIGTKFHDHIVLITMDEESEEFLGEKYPFTFASHNRMVGRLIKDRPHSLGYLVAFSKLESEAQFKGADQFRDHIFSYTDQGGVFVFGTQMDSWGEQIPPIQLRKLGYHLAQINVDNFIFAKDGVVRRSIVKVSGEDSFHLFLANKYRRSKGENNLNQRDMPGNYYKSDADAIFSLFRYHTNPTKGKSRVRRIPFHRVVVGNFPKGYFSNKIVLVGSTYISKVSDHNLSPFDKKGTKAENLALHGAIVESMVQGKFVTKIPKLYSWALSILIAIFLSYVVLRFSPVRGFMITAGVLVSIVIVSFGIFFLMGWWLYMTYPVLTVCVVYYVSVPFRAVYEYQHRYAIEEESVLLKRIEGLKRNFLSLMSHDLKTPVAKIAGIADIMIHQSGAEENREKLQTIIDSTRELNKFITAILDLTKIESESIIINKVSKDINTIIESSIESLNYEAERAGVTVETNLSPLFPIELDVHLMKRVISNLIENAIKYSGRDSSVSVVTLEDGDWIKIEIRDNGIGIPESDLEHIFDKFYRVRNDSTHSIKGSGLGLYLVKYFINLHGGKISVISKEDRGTIFCIRLRNA